jgi:hypothetical protein
MSDAEDAPLPNGLLSDLSEVHWLEPWWCFCLDKPELGRWYEDELRRELGDTHALYPHRAGARAIAKREDCDDVLFWLPQGDGALAVVHLTWKGATETQATWPRASMLTSLSDFIERNMKPVHQDWSGN